MTAEVPAQVDLASMSDAALEAIVNGEQLPDEQTTPESENNQPSENTELHQPQLEQPPEGEAPPLPLQDQVQEEQAKEEPAEQPHTFSNMREDERRAVEIRERNPDITLDQAISMARQELGIGQEDQDQDEEEQTPPEPTLAEKISEIEAQIDEAGASEGLFTKEIAELTKEHARLVAKQALADERNQQVQAQEEAQFLSQREEHIENLKAQHPEILDPESPISRKIGEVISRLSAEENSILLGVDAPEKVFYLAVSELPAEQRPASLSGGLRESQQPPVENRPAQPRQQSQPTPTAQPKPSYRPASGEQRSAVTDSTFVPPAQVGEFVRNLDLDTLERAINGDREPDFYIR